MKHHAFRLIRRVGLYASPLLMAGCVCEPSAKSLSGPTGPGPVSSIAELIVLATGSLTTTGNMVTFTVTAVDAQKDPVQGSQNGIVILIPEGWAVDTQITDEPDPQNAMVRVTITRWSRDATIVVSQYQNPAGALVRTDTRVDFNHAGAKVIADPGGPLTLQVGERQPVSFHVLTESNQAVANGDQMLFLFSDLPEFEAIAGWQSAGGEPSGDETLQGTIVARAPGFRRFRFIIHNPTHSAEVEVNVVQPGVTTLRVEPGGPLALSPDQTLVLRVTAMDDTGQPVLSADGDGTPAFPLRIGATSTASDIVEVVGVGPATPLDGTAEVTIRAKSGGTGRIVLTHPDVAGGLEVAVTVVAPPAGNVVSVASTDAIHVNLTTDLEAVIYDAVGNQVPGDDFVTATTSDAAVATIEAKIDEVANDGRVKFRVKGVSVGQATITYHYPGGPNGDDTTDTTILTVNP